MQVRSTRRNNNGQFISNQQINNGGMLTAEKEETMSYQQVSDMGENFVADFVRHLMDGDTCDANKMLKMLSAERQIEACEKGLISLGETLEYYNDRLNRWSADVDKWDEGYTFRYDGRCSANSKGMDELRLQDFELYKKFLKAGAGVPYYKDYDLGGVECTKIAIRNTRRAVDWLSRRCEDHKLDCDQLATEEEIDPSEEKVNINTNDLKFHFRLMTELEEKKVYPEPNNIHWNWVRHFGELKVEDIKRNASKWEASYIFRVMKTLVEKQERKELLYQDRVHGLGLLYKELLARTGNSYYADQVEAMRDAWRKLNDSKKEATPEIFEEEEENYAPVYEMPSYSLTEDEMIMAIDKVYHAN